jgi:hypothetical protein
MTAPDTSPETVAALVIAWRGHVKRRDVEFGSAAMMPGYLSAACDLIEALARERDLAVAHDRQPYPTAYAYERVCAVLEEKRAALAQAEAERDEARERAYADLDVAITKVAGTSGVCDIERVGDGGWSVAGLNGEETAPTPTAAILAAFVAACGAP